MTDAVTANRIAALAAVVERLERTYEVARRRLALQNAGSPWTPTDLEPEDMVDMGGRYILLDALVALTEAQVALLRATA